MKLMRSHIRLISIILIINLLSSGCVVYRDLPTPVEEINLEQVADQKIRMSVQMEEGGRVTLIPITRDGALIFKFLDRDGERHTMAWSQVSERLDQEGEIYLENKDLSVTLTVIAVAVPLTLVVYVFANAGGCCVGSVGLGG